MGFSADNAPYYAVLRFDSSKPKTITKDVQLKKGKYTTVAHIEPLSTFICVK